MTSVQPQRIDLTEFVRAFLSGAIGEENPSTMEEAIAGVTRLLVARAHRRLNQSESTRVAIEVASQWADRRAAAATGPFHTSDGHYIASDADRRAHQRTLDEKAVRHAARVARYGATEAGRAALADAAAEDAA